MGKIIGNTTATPNPRPDWNQTDANKADYIKNKPTNVSDFQNDVGYLTEHQSLDGLASEDYVKSKIAEIPTPDVSGQINAHNLNTSAHADIREEISQLSSEKVDISDLETIKAEITLAVIESLGGNPIFGYVDENNNIIVSGNLADGDYTVKYEMEDGSFVIVGELELDTNVYYSITKNLTNCSISNSASTVVEGESYSATISANDGYELKSVTVTMGGSSVSVTNGVINITSVTGNIVITAIAEEEIITPTYTNLADSTSADWQEGYRLSISSGTTSKLEGHTTTNFIRVKSGDVLRVKGLRIVDTSDTTGGSSASPKIVKYTIDKAKQSGAYGTVLANSSQSYGTSAVINGDVTTLTLLVCNDGVNYSDENLAYIRIDGFLMDGYTSKDVIITKNEEII